MGESVGFENRVTCQLKGGSIFTRNLAIGPSQPLASLEKPMHPRSLAVSSAPILALCFSALAWSQTQPADRLLSPIVASQRTLIAGVHPLAVSRNDIGRVSANQVFHRMVLLLQRSAAQQADLTQLLKDQQDPASPQYHRWLTPTEFGRRFGPSDADMAKIVGWLQSQGFSVEKPSNGRQFLFFTGASAQVEAAFQTEMHRYSVNGKTYIANAKPATIPSALAPDVSTLASLNNFKLLLPQSYPAAKPQILIGQEIFTSPADLDAIYDAAPLQSAGIKGQGESIALIEESNINLQDLTDFRNVTGLPPANVNVIVNGPDPGLLAGDGEEFEAIADVEYAGAMAPDATLNFIVSASTEFFQGIDLSTVYAVDYDVSPITSMSYGGCETLNDAYSPGITQLFADAYEQGAAEGISHFVSSGDNGGDDCWDFSAGYGVNAIGDSPWNVSTGGTEFIMPDPYLYFPPMANYTASGYIPESAWNDYENPYDGRPLAGNGGVSIDFTKPSWQTGPGVPQDGQRDTPDVSLLAGDNLAYLTCEADIGYNCANGIGGGVIGTSLASPNWAAIQALIDQKNDLLGGAGNPNPTYYQLAASANSPFHDITVGDTKVPDPNGELVGYAAGPGFDLATGLGSVDVNKLATNWMPPTGSGVVTVALTTNTAAITHGDPLTASVTVASTSSVTPTGDVVLMAGTQGVALLTLQSGAQSFTFGPTTGVELPGGAYNLTARYEGDSNFAPAASSAIALTVNPEQTTTAGYSNALTSVPYGTPVVLSAEATGSNSGTSYAVPGSYSFSENGVTLGTATIARAGESFAYLNYGSTANLTLSGAHTLTAGTHSIEAASPPASASFLASASAPIAVTVIPGSVLVSLVPDHTTPSVNSTVNLHASVINLWGQNNNSYVAVPVTGKVDFYDFSASPFTRLGTATLPALPDASGAFDVTLPYQFATAGVHVLQAEYDGDANDSPNSSGAVDVNVGGAAAKASTTTTIRSPSLVGGAFALAQQNLNIVATVAGDSAGATPTGSVTFTDVSANDGAGATIGTAAVATNGTATLTINTLAAGRHFIIASYPGDTNFAPSASQSIQAIIGDFTLSASPSSATVVAGQSSSAITLTYAGSADFTTFVSGAAFDSGVTLSCSGLPTGAACSFSTAVIAPTDNANGSTSGTATVIISTTGPTLVQASLGAPRSPWGHVPPLSLAGLLALGLPLAFRRRRLFITLLGLAICAAALTLNGCGSGGKYNISSPGTTAGTSTVTVTATVNGGSLYGALSHTATIALTVNSAGQ